MKTKDKEGTDYCTDYSNEKSNSFSLEAFENARAEISSRYSKNALEVVKGHGVEFFFKVDNYERCFYHTGCAFALYEKDGKEYMHCGVVFSFDDVEKWLDGETPTNIVIIYP